MIEKKHFEGVLKGFFIAFLAFALIFGIGGLRSIINNPLTSLAVSQNTLSYSQDLNIIANKTTKISLTLKNHPQKFDLSSFKINGKIKRGSDIKVYLSNGDSKFLVYDSLKGGLSLTGGVINENNEYSNDKIIDFKNRSLPHGDDVKIIESLKKKSPKDILNKSNERNNLNSSIIENDSEKNASLEVIEKNIENESKKSYQRNSLKSFLEKCEDSCNLRNKGFGKENLNLIIKVNHGEIILNHFEYDIIDLSKKIIRTSNFEVESVVYNLLENGNGKADVIIEFKNKSQIDQGSVNLKNSNNLKLIHKFNDINTISAEINGEGFEKLRSRSDIKRIYINKILHTSLADSIPLIHAEEVWKKKINNVNITGEGQSVCVIDTGVNYNHPALEGKVIAQKCYCYVSGVNCCPNGNSSDNNSMDDNGHGTHIAGIITSSDPIYRGISPGAKIVSVKVCNSGGECSSSDIMSGLEFCTINKEKYNISAISISIGGQISYSSYCDSLSSSMTELINNAVSQGILIAIAGGNSGNTNGISWPSCIQNATAVSSVNKLDKIPDYSNRAGITDLLGVGGDSSNPIISLGLSGGTVGKYGTSMATPHISGAVPLLVQYGELYNRVTFSPKDIENLMKKSGKQIIDDSTGRGYPRIDLQGAINSILKINSSESSVEKEGFGKIKFKEAVNLKEACYAFSISQNSISLNSSDYPSLNIPSEITLNNLSFKETPVILKNGEVCKNCSIISYANGNVIFTVEGFSEYSTTSNSNLSVWNSAEEGMPFYSGNSTLNRKIAFFGSYINKSNGEILMNATCNITFQDESQIMEFNSTKNIYEFSRNFSQEGDYNYSIICKKENFENANASRFISITKLSPSIILTLNGKESNISIIRNMNITINSSLIGPNESINLYLNGIKINSGRNVENITSFNNYSLNNLTSSYSGSSEYYPSHKTLWINVINDSSPPQFSNFSDSSSKFNENHSLVVNVKDEVSVNRVWIEIDLNGSLENIPAERTVGDRYKCNLPIIRVGNYSYKWYSNDSSGNLNFTSQKNYSIFKGDNPLKLYVNGQEGDLRIEYGNEINVTAIGKGGINLYRDNLSVSNPDILILESKDSGYSYFVNSSGNENYSENSSKISVKVYIDKINSEINLKLNDKREALNTTHKTVKINAELLAPKQGDLRIYKESSLLSSGSSPLEINGSFSPGKYLINASYEGGIDYLPSSEAFVLIISNETLKEYPIVSSTSSDSTPHITNIQSLPSPHSCNEEWRCTEWKECLNEKQTRECYDKNNCGTSLNKPKTVQNCSFPKKEQLLGLLKLKESSSQIYGLLKNLNKNMWKQTKKEPIIILPLLGLLVFIILLAINEISLARATLKKRVHVRRFIKKFMKNEMQHMQKRN